MDMNQFQRQIYAACEAWNDALQGYREPSPIRAIKFPVRRTEDDIERPRVNLDTLEGQLTDD